jgi:uncharacterized secreted protein with C-terminal beta-propeller domain
VGTGTGTGRHLPGAAVPEPARLASYTDCTDLVGQLQHQALAHVGPYGLQGGADVVRSEPAVPTGAPGLPEAAAPAAAGAAPFEGATASTAAGTAGGSAGVSGQGGPGFSTTNNQEQGVDEPDIAKTDGTLLVTLRGYGDTLQVADVGSSPRLRGALALTSLVQGTGLFLVGQDAVVLGRKTTLPTPVPGETVPPAAGTGAARPAPSMVAPAIAVAPTGTDVVVVDLSDPDHPRVARSFSVQGDLVDARLIGGTVEVVVRSTPHLPFVTPADGSAGALAAATAANRGVVLSSGPSSWLPSVTSEPSGTTTVAPCSAAMHAADPTGTTGTATTGTTSPTTVSTVGIVPIDPTSDQPGAEVTVVGDASTVYASATSLYVATSSAPQPLVEPGAPVPMGTSAASDQSPPDSTTIDAFDLSDPATPRYVGSGQVPGTLIGQYALSEYRGDLRVATTVGWATPPPGEGTAPATPSDSRVTVLSAQSGALVQVGSVTGLGAGEKIYAVRFVGPLGYVVTFRQTDPLYVVDLSDPANPRLAGQLPLTGYSSFLQPLGNGLVLGVGQNVDDNLRRTGLQVSLFDVSDPANPKLLSKDVLAGASSNAEQDPHALLFWAATGTVVLPVVQWQAQPVPVDGGAEVAPGAEFSGAMVWKLAGASLSESGRITQPVPAAASAPGAVAGQGAGAAVRTDVGGMAAMAPQIERALVVGDKLYTVSEGGILQSDLSTLAPGAFMAYS